MRKSAINLLALLASSGFVSLDHPDKLGGGKQLPHQWTLELRQDE